MSQHKYIVVTGAAGFIGSGVVRHLNDKGCSDLILVDDLDQGEKWLNLRGKKFYDFIPKDELFEWLKGKENEISAFIHLGACSNTLERDADFLLKNNYKYSLQLATYALQHGQRFIYASSAATYGDGKLGFVDAHEELNHLSPLNMYGFSKQLFDLWAKRTGAIDKIVGLKYFNVFGPNENHKGEMASMVYKMFPKVMEEGVIRLFKSSEPARFKDGDQCRDFIYVKDAVAMTCQFLENSLTGIFNIGYGKGATWNQLAKALFKAAEKDPNIEYIPMPEKLALQYQNYTCADMSKYKKAHGYGAEIPFLYTLEEAVQDYVQNYLMPAKRW